MGRLEFCGFRPRRLQAIARRELAMSLSGA